MLAALSQARRWPTHPVTVMFYTHVIRGLAIHILRKMAYKVGRVFCRVLWPWFLIAARPRGGIEHYGNWVCRPTTSLRERCEHTTSTLFVSYCISDSAYSKSYKAKGSTCVSIFDQWLLWSGSRPAVQT